MASMGTSFDDDSKIKLTAVDKLIKFCGGISEKEAALACSFFLGVCFITCKFSGFNAIPHVVVFTYMVWAASRMMASAFRNIAKGDDDNKKRSGGFGLPQVFTCPFKAYSFFLIACFILYNILGGDIHKSTWRNRIAYISCCLEGFGLISLLRKIADRGHVRGLSGMSMIMLALTYTMREVEAFLIAHVHWHNMNDVFLEVLQISAMLLSYKALWCIFKTHRTSYEQDLDVVKVKYLIPGCLLLGFLLHPNFRRGHRYSESWATSFYIDVLALLPQVVMMQRGDGVVEAPIAHFVAATFVSRFFDLLFWYDRWHRGDFLKYMKDTNESLWIIAFFHLVSIALVADFMYYYFKWRMSSDAHTSDHIEISVDP